MINHVDFEFIYRAVLRNAIKPAQLTSELVGKPEVLYTDSGSVHFRKYTINPKSKMINIPSQIPNDKYNIPKCQICNPKKSPKDSRVSQHRQQRSFSLHVVLVDTMYTSILTNASLYKTVPKYTLTYSNEATIK